jgi:hypothetical protein
MTKRDLAKKIIETLDNFDFVGASDEKKLESVIGYFYSLVPKDREQFAKWGIPDEQSTPDKCRED